MKYISVQKNIAIFCGSKKGKKLHYKNEIIDTLKLLSTQNYKFIYGGGKIGLMGVAFKEINKCKGYITGIIPKILNKKNIRQNNKKNLIVVNSMYERKELMIKKADLFLIFPGGYGTLDELFEVLTMNQLKIINKPIVIFNIEKYWDPLKFLIQNMYQQGFISKEDLKHVHWANSPKNVRTKIKKLI